MRFFGFLSLRSLHPFPVVFFPLTSLHILIWQSLKITFENIYLTLISYSSPLNCAFCHPAVPLSPSLYSPTPPHGWCSMMHTVLIWPLELLLRSLSLHLTAPPHVTLSSPMSLSPFSSFHTFQIWLSCVSCFLFSWHSHLPPQGLTSTALSLSHFLFSHFPLLLLLSFHSSSQLPCLGSIWQPDPVCGYVCVWSCCGPCAYSWNSC